jgi:hypothetical protein
MTSVCSTCGDGSARLHPAGWRCGECAPAYAGKIEPMPPGPHMRQLEAAEPCGHCHRPSWSADEAGPAHGCCIAWKRVIKAGRPCPACQVAEIVLRQSAHQPDGTIRQVRLPALPPLPQALPDGTPYTPDFGSRALPAAEAAGAAADAKTQLTAISPEVIHGLPEAGP